MNTLNDTVSKRGVTLSEVIVVLLLVGILSALALPFVPDAFSHSNDHQARVRAEALQSAQLVYRSRIPMADENWASAGTDAARYALLRNAGYLPMSPVQWNWYQPDGYIFIFGPSLTDRVTILKANGELLQ